MSQIRDALLSEAAWVGDVGEAFAEGLKARAVVLVQASAARARAARTRSERKITKERCDGLPELVLA